MMRSPLILASALVVICILLAASSPALAEAQWDARGKLALDPSVGLAYGFEGDPSEVGFEIEAYGPGDSVGSKPQQAQDGDGLEGERALVMGGTSGEIVRVEFGPALSRFEGRRVRVSLWYLPQGTEPTAAMAWHMGDEQTNNYRMSTLRLLPTGRRTTDGWVEISTQAFDYRTASISPGGLTLVDAQIYYGQYNSTAPANPDARVLVDALQIEDLGPALVPEAACNSVNAASVCGTAGECMLGRCVDPAVTAGAALSDSVRRNYIDRALHEMDLFAGVRAGRARLEEYKSTLGALAGERDSSSFWKQSRVLHELMLDGHGSSPSFGTSFLGHLQGGVCLGPGVADLIDPGADPLAPMPMVFDVSDSSLGAELKRGDVLTQIDGVDAMSWVRDRPDAFYFNGDPRGRDVLSLGSIMGAAIAKGATLRFERCDKPDATSCTPNEVEIVEIDTAARFAQVWSGGEPANGFGFIHCDWRFERVQEPSSRSYPQYFTAWRDEGDVRHLLINGVPDTTQSGQIGTIWRSVVDSALSGGAERLIIDQRTGYGGTISTLALVVGHLLQPGNDVFASFYPWFGEIVDETMRTMLRACSSNAQDITRDCGLFYEVTPMLLSPRHGSGNARVALLNAFDVSGNDYLSRFAQFRQAPTRIFGYAPTFGAFGQSCSFAGHLGEPSPMRYQCHDTTFSAGAGMPEGPFESGVGVVPDEIIYQTQSDAIAGRDTLLEAARAWVESDQP